MIYDLNNDLDRKRFLARCKSLYNNRKVVEMIDASKRTYKQNNYLHTILAFFALECGMDKNSVKQQLYKTLCNADLYVKKEFNPKLNMEVVVIRSSSELTTEEMSLSIDRFRKWSEEQGIYLPSPEEQNYLEQMALMVEQNKRWL